MASDTSATYPANPGKEMTAEDRLSALSQLLENVEESFSSSPSPKTQTAISHQNQLAQVRLGMAGALYQALRCKHAPTASHSLRVAIGCSCWGLTRDLTDQQRDEIEVAALLHDIGKIGVPDHVLLKPSKLLGEELLLMERHRQHGQSILRACCASQSILDTVNYSAAWYNGSRHGYDRSGNELPLGSRMIAIVDAFDSMVTDHVYRRAMSRERALAELFEYAGTQFDGALIREFCEHFAHDRIQLNSTVTRRWLQQLKSDGATPIWVAGGTAASEVSVPVAEQQFQQKLLDTMHDGVIFVSSQRQILRWNRGAERLTGISEKSVEQQTWEPEMIGLRDESGRPITSEEDPVDFALRAGSQVHRRLSVNGRNNQQLCVDLHIAPVIGAEGLAKGVTMMLHDASSQATLEERVQSLAERATQDPLTKVANRAEFNRLHEVFVTEHLAQGLPCSLIICDIDHFKKINDVHGHPAGDAALIGFAGILSRNCRSGDLVARYGGEEFVMLCADCDNATATARAEEIRRQLESTPQPAIGGNYITASFGVTEIQGGDTSETMLNRADRALLQAKTNGRNMVVQLGSGINEGPVTTTKTGWFSRFRSAPVNQVLERSLITAVPLNVTAEKLRGFISDHHAELISVEGNTVMLQIEGLNTPLARRTGDRNVPFMIELKLEERQEPAPKGGRASARTIIHVSVRPKRHRDRRLKDIVERARQLLVSIKSYLMAHDYTDPAKLAKQNQEAGVLSKAKNMLAYLLRS